MQQQPDRRGLFGRFADLLRSDWRTLARPEQLAPAGDWTIWLFLGGRGAGKTRAGAEWVRERVESSVGRRIHLIGPTAADVRDVMVEGPSGILATASPHMRPTYLPSLRRLEWPNGARASLFSSDEPDRLRGPQSDTVWFDELAASRQPQDTLDMAALGLRIGRDPRMLITTTPRPIMVVRQLLARDGEDIAVTRASTFDNSENLARPFLTQILARYEGTRLGRQELHAEILEDVPGALWQLARIEELRVREAPALMRVVVAVDPATTSGPDSDETGIIVAGIGQDAHFYVLDDVSGRCQPTEWAKRAIGAYHQYRADRVVGEVNQGGDMVETTLRAVDPHIPFRAVHASRGKLVRAEPASALYEKGVAHHVGALAKLEDQMTSYDGKRSGGSPDRLDAAVYALTELMGGGSFEGWLQFVGEQARRDAVAAEPPPVAPSFPNRPPPQPKPTAIDASAAALVELYEREYRRAAMEYSTLERCASCGLAVRPGSSYVKEGSKVFHAACNKQSWN